MVPQLSLSTVLAWLVPYACNGNDLITSIAGGVTAKSSAAKRSICLVRMPTCQCLGVLSREHPRDYVLVAVRSTCVIFCRNDRVIYVSTIWITVFWFLPHPRVHVCLLYTLYVSYYLSLALTGAMYNVVRDPIAIALWRVVFMSSVLISNRWAPVFSVLLPK